MYGSFRLSDRRTEPDLTTECGLRGATSPFPACTSCGIPRTPVRPVTARALRPSRCAVAHHRPRLCPRRPSWSLIVIHQRLRRQYQALNNRRWCGVGGGGVGGGGGGSDGRASYRSKAILCACLKGQPPAKERLVTRDGIAPILFFEARHSLVALVGELAVDR